MRRLLLSLALMAGSVVWLAVDAGPAAAEPDAVACTVAGGLTYAPGLTVVPAAQVVGGALTVTCVGLGDDVGVWLLTPAATTVESCQAGAGTLTWVVPSAGPPGDGAVAGGLVAYTRVDALLLLNGTLPAAGPPAETHVFSAVLAWAPVLPAPPALPCLPPPLGAPVVAATVAGVATLAD